MTTRTQPILLPGVIRHGDGYRVRPMFSQKRISETYATPEEANARILQLGQMRKAGVVPGAAGTDPLLRDAAESLLTLKRTTRSRKTKQLLRPRTIEWWERILTPWRSGQFSDLPLSLLRRASVEDVILARSIRNAKAAGDELTGLKALLRYAGQRGASFDAALLTIDTIVLTPRRRVALSVAELELLAGVAPIYAQRMILLLGTTGCRVGEFFQLTDDRINLDEGWLEIPAAFCKEGVDKWVSLDAQETHLIREQLMARAPGTSLVFPTKTGRPWRHFQFLRLVWYKARERAGFDDLHPHDLRATAATLMRDAGFTREQTAERLGHSDLRMLDQIYDVGDRRNRGRRAIDEHAPQGLRAALRAQQEAPPATRLAVPAATADGSE